MATVQQRVEDERFQQDPPIRRPSWMKGCLIGCLVTVVVLLLVGTIATIWISRNWRGWAANVASQGINQGIDSSGLPAEEKNQIKVEVNRVIVEFREGRMTNEQVARLMQNLVESPLMTTLAAAAVEAKYLNNSGLSAEEKADAKVTLQRFLRGDMDKKISKESADVALSKIGDRQPDGNYRVRENLTDAEIRAFIAAAKKAADDAQVAEQPEQFDPSDEVKRIIDQAMMEPAPPEIEIPPVMKTPPADGVPPTGDVPPAIEAPSTPAAEN